MAPLIIKGWEMSPIDPLPWHVTLFSHENGNWSFFCGGTLIAERLILTAGHCVWKTEPDTIRVWIYTSFTIPLILTLTPLFILFNLLTLIYNPNP